VGKLVLIVPIVSTAQEQYCCKILLNEFGNAVAVRTVSGSKIYKIGNSAAWVKFLMNACSLQDFQLPAN
jgi:hypothetical protein